MPAAITASELAVMEPKLILPAKFTLQAKTLATSLFHREPLPKGQGRVLNQPKYGVFEAYDATEGVEIDNPQKLSTTNFVVRPQEVAAQFLLTDLAARSGGESHMANAGRILGEAMGKRVDRRGWAVFRDGDGQLAGDGGPTQITTHALGSASTDITVGHINAAVARLEGNEEPTPKPIRAVFRAEQLRLILNSIVPTAPVTTTSGAYGPGANYAGLSQEIVTQYLKHDFRLFGIDGSFTSPNIERTSDANQTAVGAVFSQEAIWYVPADDVNVEKERRMKARSWLYQTTHMFGFGIWQEKWAVKMTFKSVDPTS